MSQVGFRKNIVIATIAIIAIGLAIAPTIFSNVAQAQAGKSVFQGEPDMPGTVTCPSSTTPVQATLDFGVDKSKGAIDGGWVIQTTQNPEEQFVNQGQITGLKITQKNSQFQLKGSQLQIDDNICNPPATASITITGQCGSGVSAQFIASNGFQGTFTGGTVTCS